ncbi:hypothetical protein H8356DRAFT_944737 [Neocallimastix lanati (nom. inval.)]|nr:hypothetical protein H8356DRAFT_944737 [Neocallimastix sp. JGI-2020a]
MSMNMNESDDFLGDIKKNERGDSIDSGMNTSMRFRFSSNNFQDILMSKIGDNRENGTVDNHNTISVKKVNIKSTTNLDDLAMKRNNSSDFPDTTYNKQNVINFSDNLLSLIKSIVFICIICYIITISMLLLYKKMENDDIQNNVDNTAQLKNYKWTYKCNLESHDIIYYIGHLIVLISIIIKGVRIYQYECIFRCTKYITYASFVMLAFGPTVNVIGLAVLSDERFKKIAFELILNNIGYFIIFILFSWDKIYYILKKEGDDCNIYFRFRKHEKCAIHNSYTCWCDHERSKKDIRPSIKRYIDFYKFCSLVITIIDGKIKYIKMKTKTDLLNASHE